MTITEIRTAIETVVGSLSTATTFYSIFVPEKERNTEPSFPFVAWEPWRSRLDKDENDYLIRRAQIRLLIVTISAKTDSTAAERDAALEEADNKAADIILALEASPYEWKIDNVSTSSVYYEGSQLDTGVVLTFTVNTDALCLSSDAIAPCPTFSELILDETWVSIKGEMTSEQLADATADLGGGDTTFTLVVNVDGVEVVNGTYDSAVDNTINVN